MEMIETATRLLEDWLPEGDWEELRQVFTDDVTYVDANNLATSGKDSVIGLLRKGNRLARLIWEDEIIPPNRVLNTIKQNRQAFVEWEARGALKNGVSVTIPGCTVLRFQKYRIQYYRDYVNFAIFVQWAQMYPEVFRELAETETAT